MKNKLPEGWNEVELGDLFELKYGSSLQAEKRIYGEFSVYGSNGVVGYHNEGITKGKTIIVGRKGSVGKINLSEKSCFPIDTTYYIDETKKPCDLKWLYYILKTLNLESLNHAAAVPGLNRNDVYSIKVSFPPLPIQKKIVSILEKAESLKQKREEADKKTKEYLQSVFVEMFYKKGFEEKVLDEITQFIDYRGKTPTKTENGVPLLTAKNVKIGYISNEPREFIAEKDYIPWMRRGFPKEGDILFTTEAPLGNVARLGKFDKIALAQRIITFQCSKELNSYYLLYALLSEKVKNRIGIQSTGSTVTGIRSKELKKIKIPLPPLHLQQKFAKIVEKVEKLKEKQKQSKEKIDNLFNSLMQKAFKGEIYV